MRTHHTLAAAAAGLALVAVGVATPSAASAAIPLPSVVSVMPSTVVASASVKKPSHGPNKPHKSKRANHGRSKHASKHAAVPPKTRASKSTPHAAHTSAVAPRVVVSGTSTSTSASPRVKPKPIPDVLQQVATAVQDTFNLFGWNLLALIPMAGIATAISRRMKPAGRSGSKRLRVSGF